MIEIHDILEHCLSRADWVDGLTDEHLPHGCMFRLTRAN